MIHIAAKVFDEHCLRMRALGEWELALWWMGLVCIVLSASLFFFDMATRGVWMAALYWPIAMARNACGYALEREARRLRRDLVACACREEEEEP